MPLDPITHLEDRKKQILKAARSDVSNQMTLDVLNQADYNQATTSKPYFSSFNKNELVGTESFRGVLDLEELSAQRQGFWELTGKGIGRFLSKTATEVLKMPGYIGGALFSGAMDGNFASNVADNQWVNTFNSLDESIKDALYVHQTKDSKEGGIGDWWNDGTFWATQGADGLGFMASFLVPGAITKGLKLASGSASLFSKGMAWAATTAEEGNILGKGMLSLDKLMASVGKTGQVIFGDAEIGAELSQISKIGKQFVAPSLDAVKVGQAIELGTITQMSTMFESASEAREAMDAYREKMQNSGMSAEEIEKNAQKIGANVMKANYGILLIPNYITSRILFGNPIKGSGAWSFAKPLVDETGKPFFEAVKDTTKKKILKYSGEMVMGAIGEGFWEEGMQTTISNYLQNKPDFKWRNLIDEAPDIARAYMEMLNTTDGQQAIFLGALFGSVMGTRNEYRGDKLNEQHNENLTKFINEHNDYLQQLVKDPYKKDTEGNIIYGLNNKPILDRDKLIFGLKAFEAKYNGTQFKLPEKNKDLEILLQSYPHLTDEQLHKQLINVAINDIAQPLASIPDGEKILKHQLTGMHEVAKVFNEGVENEKDASSKKYIDDLYQKGVDVINETKKANGFVVPLLMNIKSTEENKEIKQTFVNAKTYKYIKSIYDIKELNKEISETEAEHNKLLEHLGEDSTYRTAFSDKIDRLKQEVADKRQIIKDIVNLKLQQEEFNKLYEAVEFKREDIKTAEKFVSESDEKEQDAQNLNSELAQLDTERTNESEQQTLKNIDKSDAKEQNAKFKNMSVQEAIDKGADEIINNAEHIFNTSEDTGIDRSMFDDDGNFNHDNMPLAEEFDPPKDEKLTENIEEDVVTDEEVNDDNVKRANTTYNANDYNNVKTEVWSEAVGEEGELANFKIGGKKIYLTDNDKVKQEDRESFKRFQEWLENGKSKLGETFTFGFGDWKISENTKQAFAAYERLFEINKDKVYPQRAEDIQILKEKMPIVVINKNGDKSVVGGVNLQSISEKKNKNENTAALEHRASLQSQIVDLLLLDIPINEITSEITFQKGGSLNLQPKSNKNNAVFDLKEFEGNIDNVSLEYVNEFGELVNNAGEKTGVTIDNKNKGRIVVNVTKNNGEKFPLVLNRRTLNEKEANLIVDILDGLFTEQIKLDTTIKEITNDKLRDKLQKEFNIELSLLKNNDTKIKTILDFFVAASTKESRNRFQYYAEKNTLAIGTKVGEGKKSFITKESWTKDENDKIQTKRWLMEYKRKNVKTKYSNVYENSLTLANKEYKKYLLEGDNKTLSTNVETKDENGKQLPTFIGNSNIYFSKFVKVKGKTFEEVKQEKLTNKKAISENNLEKIRNSEKNVVSLQTEEKKLSRFERKFNADIKSVKDLPENKNKEC